MAEELYPPPRSGEGSNVEAWREFVRKVRPEWNVDWMSRSELIADWEHSAGLRRMDPLPRPPQDDDKDN
jgi:hypothetical protein